MSLLIDGYNLLHGSGILPKGVGPGTLERSRSALLNFLAEALEPGELRHTIVVFDAAAAPPGLPRSVDHHGISVRYAAQYENADELIEELIKADTSPRKLVVVSSDHRLHKAARRRKATPIDSDRWYAAMLERRRAHPMKRETGSIKPAAPATAGEVEYWLREFGEDGAAGATPDVDSSTGSTSPFPPGYAEDVIDEEP